MPERAAIRASQFFSTPVPSGVRSPAPVITTRRSKIRLIDPDALQLSPLRFSIIHPAASIYLRRAATCGAASFPGLEERPAQVKGLDVATLSQADSFLQLIDRLGELELVIGPQARPAVAEVRKLLRDAAAARQRADLPGALAIIAEAMQRLAALAGGMDGEEGAMMRAIAASFAQSLGAGDKGGAKRAMATMRIKAGDPSKKEDPDW
jgi:hypothetical protein